MEEPKVSLFKKASFGTALAALVLVGNIVVFVAQLWVSAGYVPKRDFEDYQKDQLARREKVSETLAGIAVTLGKIDERMKSDAEQNGKLDDLEKRMRSIEQQRRP